VDLNSFLFLYQRLISVRLAESLTVKNRTHTAEKRERNSLHAMDLKELPSNHRLLNKRKDNASGNDLMVQAL
jgi:hypothetical protein